jgi:hypothetical protein
MHGSAGFQYTALHRGWWALSLSIRAPVVLCQTSRYPSALVRQQVVQGISRLFRIRGKTKPTFTAANHEVLVCTTQGATDEKLPSRLTNIALDLLPSNNIK